MATLPDIKTRIVADRGNLSQVLSEVRQSLGTLKQFAADTGKSLRDSLDLRGAGTKVGDDLQMVGNQLASTKRQLLAFFVGFPALKQSLTDLFATQVDVFRAQQGLKFATGDAEKAAQEYAYLRKTADELGVSFQTVLPQYIKLAAATKGTSLEGGQTQAIFESLTKAAVTLGMSNEDLEGSFRAVTQIVSKGKATAEELRGQLGERLPGAIQILAKSLGITTAQLDDLLEKGKLTSEVAIPALTGAVNKLFSESATEAARGPQAALARLQNAFFDLRKAIGESGFMEAATAALDGLRAQVEKFGPIVGAATRFIVEHGDALRMLAGIFTAVKVGEFVASLYASAAATVRGTVASLQKTAALRAEATATLDVARAAYAQAAAEAAATRTMQARAAAGVAVQTALTSLRAAEAGYTATMAATSLAARGATAVLGALGGPIGLITTALTVGATAWAIWGDSAKKATDKAKGGLSDEAIQKRIDELGEQRKFGIGELGQVAKRLETESLEYARALEAVINAEKTGAPGAEAARNRLKEREQRLQKLIKLSDALRKTQEDALQGPQKPGDRPVALDLALSIGPQDPVEKAEEDLKKFRETVEQARQSAKERNYILSRADEDALKKREQFLIEAVNKAKKLGKGDPTFSSDIGLARALLEADKRAVESDLQTIREALEQRRKALDDSLRDEVVSVEEYWRQRESIEEDGYAAEVDAARKRREAIQREMSMVQGELVARGGKMTDADVQNAQREMVRLSGEYIQQNERAAKAAVALYGSQSDINRERTRGLRILSDEAAILKAQNEQRRGIFDETTIENAVLARNRDRLAKAIANESTNPELRVQIEADIKLQIKEEQLKSVEDRIQAVNDRLAQKQRQIELQQQTGLIAEYKAREQLIEAQIQAGAELEKLLPRYEALNGAIGSREALQRVTELKTRITELKTPADELAVSFDNAGRTALSQALSDIISGSKNAADAIQAMSQSIIKSFADIIARKLSEKLYDSLFGGTGTEMSGLLKSFINIFSGSGTSAVSATGPAVVAQSGPPLSTGGYITRWGVQRFDDGGYVAGPGTGTSDSIPARLSNGEFVVRAARVRELGVNFMHWVNGSNLARAPRFAGGGLADVQRFAAGGLASGAPAVSVVVTPEVANMTLRDWLEGHLARELATR